ncbi:uncharacterized protein CLUP02_17880 [Colletotrichum lupini]|uniref:Uncharacterized protein n=1 Tax=Colletotrichum lupini TaxID=145971 RepID=A0A9Q8SH29_9PEZI|nr:uncharacterized protein CLUP02_17880 [Colletotrichum lupini]UQC76367.1 hypothetical protein CLUP02_17880 [Colletotrichum lupini]
MKEKQDEVEKWFRNGENHDGRSESFYPLGGPDFLIKSTQATPRSASSTSLEPAQGELVIRDICRGDLGASAMANRAGPEGRQTAHGGVRRCELLQRHLSQQNDSGPAPPAHSGLWRFGGLCAWTLKVWNTAPLPGSGASSTTTTTIYGNPSAVDSLPVMPVFSSQSHEGNLSPAPAAKKKSIIRYQAFSHPQLPKLKKKKKVNGLIGHHQKPKRRRVTVPKKTTKNRKICPERASYQKKTLQARITHPYHLNPSKKSHTLANIYLVCGVVNSCYSQLHERKSPNLPIAHPLLQVPYRNPRKVWKDFRPYFPAWFLTIHATQADAAARMPGAGACSQIFYANLFANGVSWCLAFDSCAHGYECFPLLLLRSGLHAA